jgi:hypothetical protein
LTKYFFKVEVLKLYLLISFTNIHLKTKYMMRQIILKIILLALLVITNTQAQEIQWQNTLGGSAYDYCKNMIETNDGGFILIGFADSSDGDLTGNYGSYDVWVVKLDNTGNLEWQKSYGGSENDAGTDIKQTPDGGYIIAAYTSSTDGDVSSNPYGYSYWLVKIDNVGTILWEHTFGGSYIDYPNSIQITADGGYIMAGKSASSDGDVTGHHGGYYHNDYWIVKTDVNGVLEWQKSIGGDGDDKPWAIKQTPDNGYIIVGRASEAVGDVTNNYGSYDFWVVKIDSTGNILWDKNYGGTESDCAYDVSLVADGGYIVVGYTKSNDIDVTGYHGGRDIWLIKIDASGVLEWQKSLGGTEDDSSNSLDITSDGGIIVGGYSESNDGDVTENKGGKDAWIVKLDSNANILWEKSYGGSGNDRATKILQTGTGSFVFSGNTESIDGDVTDNNGDLDFWIVNLNNFASVDSKKLSENIELFPNPTADYLNISSKNLSIQKVCIYNTIGKKIKEETNKTIKD